MASVKWRTKERGVAHAVCTFDSACFTLNLLHRYLISPKRNQQSVHSRCCNDIKFDLCSSCCRREVCLPVIKRKIFCNLLSFASSELQLQVRSSVVLKLLVEYIQTWFYLNNWYRHYSIELLSLEDFFRH